MLVTFSCPAHADITMFGDVAIRLFELMGHSGAVPGALLAEDVEAALERIEAAVEVDEQLPEPGESAQGEDDEPAVSLTHLASDRIASGCGEGKVQPDVGQQRLIQDRRSKR